MVGLCGGACRKGLLKMYFNLGRGSPICLATENCTGQSVDASDNAMSALSSPKQKLSE